MQSIMATNKQFIVTTPTTNQQIISGKVAILNRAGKFKKWSHNMDAQVFIRHAILTRAYRLRGQT